VPEKQPSLIAAMMDDGDDAQQLTHMMEGLWTAQVVVAITRLGIPDLLAAGGPRPAADLARESGADAGALGRLLAGAAAYGLLRRDADGGYTLTGVGELLRTYAPGSASSLTGFLSPPMWIAGSKITQIVRGEAVDPSGIYEFFGEHPDEAQWFVRAMSQVTGLLVSELAATQFRPLATGRIVDVGGSRGTLLAHLLQAVPEATGVLFDRPEALAEAPQFLAAAGVNERVELAAGDFMREVPGGGDLYVLSQVLHNWGDDVAHTIVGNCRRASKPDGSLLVIEYVLPDGPEPSAAHLMDLIMLVLGTGRERTRAELEELMGSFGYSPARTTALTAMPWQVMEFTLAGAAGPGGP
jgi:hypothetical protein